MTTFTDADAVLRKYWPGTVAARHTGKLDVMYALLKQVGSPHERLRVVHIAGTSGKTSTAYYTASLLTAAGYKVGLTVSPHVDQLNERVQVDGMPLTETDFCAELTAFMGLVRSAPLQPTYFELMVAFALWHFVRANVDVAVVEVGIGGLLDSTNVLTRADKVCVLTDIGLDHVGLLGTTLEQIAAQKAGIMHAHNVAFCHEQPSEVMRVFRAWADKQDAELRLADAAVPATVGFLPLFQQRNFSLALSVVQYMLNRDGTVPLGEEQIAGVAHTMIPARMEVRRWQGKTIILDGAHNTQKLQALRESIRAAYDGQPLALLVGFLADHGAVGEKVAAIAPLADHAIVTSFSGRQNDPYRSEPVEVVAEAYEALGYSFEPQADVTAALDALLRRPEPVLVITGSFYLLNYVRPLLAARQIL